MIYTIPQVNVPSRKYPMMNCNGNGLYNYVVQPMGVNPYVNQRNSMAELQKRRLESMIMADPKLKKKLNHTEDFSVQIKNLIKFAEGRPSQNYSINNLCEKIGFQRRRLYDVINVLEVAGCCKRINVDTVKWYGLENTKTSISDLVKVSNVKSLADIAKMLPNEKIISISHLTKLYFLMFSALSKKEIDIRATAKYLASENGRLKTTLCKLYQITYILCAVGIFVKSDTPSIVCIKDEYFHPCGEPVEQEEESEPQCSYDIPDSLKIENLLSSSPVREEPSIPTSPVETPVRAVGMQMLPPIPLSPPPMSLPFLSLINC